MIIGSKKEISTILEPIIEGYSEKGMDFLLSQLDTHILKQKVRFPLLEFCALKLNDVVVKSDQFLFSEKIISLKEIGGNVVAGIILQQNLDKRFDESIKKACEFIVSGNEWYVCDIIGERVMGYALLHYPKKTIPLLQALSSHSDKWIVRTIGVASHYAIKKGLKRKYVQQVFELLLSLSDTTDFHTKKGIGWAAKTTAKFYPDLIKQYKTKIESSEVKQWFRTKINIGLGRSEKYASRYSG